jgi:hypothetical protein
VHAESRHSYIATVFALMRTWFLTRDTQQRMALAFSLQNCVATMQHEFHD